jgi:hypothetical protein
MTLTEMILDELPKHQERYEIPELTAAHAAAISANMWMAAGGPEDRKDEFLQAGEAAWESYKNSGQTA